jgi:IPT/TIG domain/Malectin domain
VGETGLEEELDGLDVYAEAGGKYIAITKSITVPVTNGELRIQFNSRIENPKVSAIEVIRSGDHYSHAVVGGPYAAVDVDGDGFQSVPVDGSQSHTHGQQYSIASYIWKKGSNVIGTGVSPNLLLPTGDNVVTLTVTDTSGSISHSTTTIPVKQKGFPELFSLSPLTGGVAGGTTVTLVGQDIGTATQVRFGKIILSGSAITSINSGSISFQTPGPAVGVPVQVSVITPVGESSALTYTYVATMPIQFSGQQLMTINKPTALAFGPDGKLYVATQEGKLLRVTLNDAYDGVVNIFTSTVTTDCILGIAFNPLETPEMGDSISVYISVTKIYQGEIKSSSGEAINGRIQRVRGAKLDDIVDVIKNLPASQLDHAVNALYFGEFVGH